MKSVSSCFEHYHSLLFTLDNKTLVEVAPFYSMTLTFELDVGLVNTKTNRRAVFLAKRSLIVQIDTNTRLLYVNH